jgi:hypothetical protein
MFTFLIVVIKILPHFFIMEHDIMKSTIFLMDLKLFSWFYFNYAFML